MDAGWVVGLLGGLAAFVAALCAAVTGVLAARSSRKKTETDDAIARYQRLTDRLERHVEQQQEIIDQLTEEHTACQAQLARMYAWLLRFRDAAQRLCRAGGLDPEKELPELPPAPPEPSGASEFRARTARHNTGLMRDAARGPRPCPDPGPGGGSSSEGEQP